MYLNKFIEIKNIVTNQFLTRLTISSLFNPGPKGRKAKMHLVPFRVRVKQVHFKAITD
jgi:hypothetical protein